jgi:hypothetical protein
VHVTFGTVLQKNSIPNQNLPQLYRFCFLMLGDATKAQEVFESIMHDAALRAAQGELPRTDSGCSTTPDGDVWR